jgi:hypothetical protein
MSREEKIEFIRSSSYFNFAYDNLQSFSDQQLDEIIMEISSMMQRDENKVAGNLLESFYVYLN